MVVKKIRGEKRVLVSKCILFVISGFSFRFLHSSNKVLSCVPILNVASFSLFLLTFFCHCHAYDIFRW